MRKNEERLNEIFIDIYGLGEEISPEVDEVSVHKSDLSSDIRNLVSYAV